MPSRVTTTLVTALFFLTAPLWAPSMPDATEANAPALVILLGLATTFTAISWVIHRWPASAWAENALMLVFLLEVAAVEILNYHADQAGYRVSPVISVAVPVGVLALCRLPVLRSVLFVAMFCLLLLAKDRLLPEIGAPRSSTETLTIAILLSLVLVSSAFSQRTRRQNWALLQLQRAGAQIDFLTGLSNRSAYEAHVEQWTRASQRDARPYCVALVDFDYFKCVNDRYGHAHGDEVLRTVTQTIERYARRPGDLAARVGGEEFVLFLYGCDRPSAEKMLDELRVEIHSLSIDNQDSPFKVVTVSIGAAAVAHAEPIATTYEKADGALYQAKRQGRNQLCWAVGG